MPATDPLLSWNDTGTRQAIVEFVEAVTTDGRDGYLPPVERVAVFDNDGTLWCEKPMPIELGFILQRLAAMAAQDDALRDRQPWKATWTGDHHWLGEVITRHYAGDDSDLKVLLGGILQAFAGMDVEEYQVAAHTFLHSGRHPTLGRGYSECGYRPMIELLEYLEANGFTTYIASGGDRDFMRPISETLFGIPSERVIGSSNALRYDPDDGGGSAGPRAGQGPGVDGGQHRARLGDRVRLGIVVPVAWGEVRIPTQMASLMAPYSPSKPGSRSTWPRRTLPIASATAGKPALSMSSTATCSRMGSSGPSCSIMASTVRRTVLLAVPTPVTSATASSRGSRLRQRGAPSGRAPGGRSARSSTR